MRSWKRLELYLLFTFVALSFNTLDARLFLFDIIKNIRSLQL